LCFLGRKLSYKLSFISGYLSFISGYLLFIIIEVRLPRGRGRLTSSWGGKSVIIDYLSVITYQ